MVKDGFGCETDGFQWFLIKEILTRPLQKWSADYTACWYMIYVIDYSSKCPHTFSSPEMKRDSACLPFIAMLNTAIDTESKQQIFHLWSPVNRFPNERLCKDSDGQWRILRKRTCYSFANYGRSVSVIPSYITKHNFSFPEAPISLRS